MDKCQEMADNSIGGICCRFNHLFILANKLILLAYGKASPRKVWGKLLESTDSENTMPAID